MEREKGQSHMIIVFELLNQLRVILLPTLTSAANVHRVLGSLNFQVTIAFH